MIIKAARPNISDNSIKQYMSSLRTLNGGSAVPINNVDFLKDFDVVMEKLKEKKPTTIKNYMNAIIVVLGALKMDDVLIKQYEAVRDKLNGQYSEEQAKPADGFLGTNARIGLPRFPKLLVGSLVGKILLALFASACLLLLL